MYARTIALANQKGGIAKTTTAVNLGVGLAQEGFKVLVADCDPQASLTNALGIRNPDKLTKTLSEAMMAEMNDKAIPEEFGICRHEEGIDLFPANITLSGVELNLFNAMSREVILRNVLEKVRNRYDYILLDCMPSLWLMTINALTAADRVIIPSQPSYLSSKGINLLLSTIAKVKRQINPKLCIDGILFTMVDRRTNNAKDILTVDKASLAEFIGHVDDKKFMRAVDEALEIGIGLRKPKKKQRRKAPTPEIAS